MFCVVEGLQEEGLFLSISAPPCSLCNVGSHLGFLLCISCMSSILYWLDRSAIIGGYLVLRGVHSRALPRPHPLRVHAIRFFFPFPSHPSLLLHPLKFRISIFLENLIYCCFGYFSRVSPLFSVLVSELVSVCPGFQADCRRHSRLDCMFRAVTDRLTDILPKCDRLSPQGKDFLLKCLGNPLFPFSISRLLFPLFLTFHKFFLLSVSVYM